MILLELAKGIEGLARGVTLYASANDRALQISRGIWRSYRAGDVSPAGPTLAVGIETIDGTAASTDVFSLNHSGYAENNDLLKDVGALLEKGVHPPEARSEILQAVESPKGRLLALSSLDSETGADVRRCDGLEERADSRRCCRWLGHHGPA